MPSHATQALAVTLCLVTWGHTNHVPKKPDGSSSPRRTLPLLSPGSSPVPRRRDPVRGSARHTAGHMVHRADVL